jgi:crotonobetainyl-CoA:carnitine CoA-transferase CaiB-like acyl-CoA transferase
MFADPQVQHVSMAVPMPHPTQTDAAVVNQAVELSRTPSVINRPTPALGEHSEEILAGLGYSSNDIAPLRSKKVI